MSSIWNTEYHLFDTRFYRSLKKAKAKQIEMDGYCGASVRKSRHVASDIEIYELKRVMKSKRVKLKGVM
jgi:hypothetical protein